MVKPAPRLPLVYRRDNSRLLAQVFFRPPPYQPKVHFRCLTSPLRTSSAPGSDCAVLCGTAHTRTHARELSITLALTFALTARPRPDQSTPCSPLLITTFFLRVICLSSPMVTPLLARAPRRRSGCHGHPAHAPSSYETEAAVDAKLVHRDCYLLLDGTSHVSTPARPQRCVCVGGCYYRHVTVVFCAVHLQ